MSFAKNVFQTGFGYELISAHTHVILVGSVMMMIMGIALWFFPRAEKKDKRYNPDLILIVYWVMTTATSVRFISQVVTSFYVISWISILITITSAFQVIAMLIFFYSMWGRIRPVGSQYREAKGEKF